MGKVKDERTLQMIKNYESLWRKGFTPTMVAKEFNLSRRTVYNYLPEIAEKIGVTREELLEIPHSEHVRREKRFEPVELIDLTEFHEDFGEMEKAFKRMDMYMMNMLASFKEKMEEEDL